MKWFERAIVKTENWFLHQNLPVRIAVLMVALMIVAAIFAAAT